MLQFHRLQAAASLTSCTVVFPPTSTPSTSGVAHRGAGTKQPRSLLQARSVQCARVYCVLLRFVAVMQDDTSCHVTRLVDAQNLPGMHNVQRLGLPHTLCLIKCTARTPEYLQCNHSTSSSFHVPNLCCLLQAAVEPFSAAAEYRQHCV